MADQGLHAKLTEFKFPTIDTRTFAAIKSTIKSYYLDANARSENIFNLDDSEITQVALNFFPEFREHEHIWNKP